MVRVVAAKSVLRRPRRGVSGRSRRVIDGRRPGGRGLLRADGLEDLVALSDQFPTTPARAGVVTHAGETTLTEDAYTRYFANGIPHEQAEVLFAEQEPTAASLFAERTTVAAWHDKPTFYAVSKQDMTIAPELEEFLAEFQREIPISPRSQSAASTMSRHTGRGVVR